MGSSSALREFYPGHRDFSAHVIVVSNVVFILLALIGLTDVRGPAEWFLAPSYIILFSAGAYFAYRGRLRAASILSLLVGFALVTINVVAINGIFNVNLGVYVLIILYAVILLPRREVILTVTALSIAATLLLAWAQSQGWIPFVSAPPSAVDRVLVTIGIFASSGILLSAAAHVIQRGLARVYAQEVLLKARNSELEMLAKRLQASEESYRLMFESAAIHATVYDVNGHILLMNQSAAQFHEGTPDGFLGKTLHDLFAPPDAEAIKQMHAQTLEVGVPMVYEGVATRANGQQFDYQCQVIPLPALPHLPDAPRRVLGLTTDMTQHKTAARQARELQLAQERNEYFRQFFGTITHDLKTPLTIMRSNLYLMSKMQDPTRRQGYYETFGQQLTLLERYIQDMLTIARMETTPQLETQPLDLCAVTQDVVSLLQSRAEFKNIGMTCTTPGDPLWIDADENEVRRLLVNLVENAVNYTPDGGEVRVSAQRASDQVALTIRDTGIGIPPEAQGRIFEAFYRTDEARDVLASGSGLGLAIVKRIVDLHGGDIDLQSAPGQGTTFTVRLPALLTAPVV